MRVGFEAFGYGYQLTIWEQDLAFGPGAYNVLTAATFWKGERTVRCVQYCHHRDGDLGAITFTVQGPSFTRTGWEVSFPVRRIQ